MCLTWQRLHTNRPEADTVGDGGKTKTLEQDSSTKRLSLIRQARDRKGHPYWKTASQTVMSASDMTRYRFLKRTKTLEKEKKSLLDIKSVKLLFHSCEISKLIVEQLGMNSAKEERCLYH